MKKITSLLIVFAILVTSLLCFGAGMAFAATSGSCGSNATWAYDESTNTLTISGTGAVDDCGVTASKRAKWASYRSTMKTLVVEEGITSLGQLTMYSCTALESVSLPSTLTTIRGGTLNYGAFRECSALKNITLPENLTSIEAYAFNGCTSLTSITFPDSLTSLGTYAFTECTSLKTVTYGTGLTATGSFAFYNAGVSKIKFSSTVTEISSYSFYGTSLINVELPDTVTSIGTRAFANCTSLQSATIYNANCTFNGVVGEDPFNGSQQSLVIKGHSGSTAQTYASEKGYTFESIDDCEHTSTHEVIATAATCTQAGKTTQVCDACGFVVSETEIPATGHTYETVSTDDQTATDGHIYELQQCSVCGAEQTVPTHKAFVEGYYQVKTVFNCKTGGWETKTCTVDGCGKTERSALPSGHKVENITSIQEPTCTQEGSQTGTCSVCGETVTETIPATGHTLLAASETLDNTATDGHTYVVRTCSVCGEKISTPTHVEWVDGQYTSTVITEPTCTVNGLRRDTCSICGEKRTVTVESKGGHEWYEVSRTEATCSAQGAVYYNCSNCTATKKENLEKLAHTNELTEEVAPGCTTAGYKTYRCSVCGATTKEILNATGHTASEDSYTITQAATCETDGAATAVCATCGESFDIVIAATGHDYEDVITAADGKEGHSYSTPTCANCGATQETALVHDEWIDGQYTSALTQEGNCVKDEIYTDTCTVDGCGETRQRVTKEAVGAHDYEYTGTDSDTGYFTYTCSVCGDVISRSPLLVYPFWNVQYVGKTPDEVTNGYLLELSGDGIINAKDYAILNKAYKSRLG